MHDYAQNKPYVARIVGLFALSIVDLCFNICAGKFRPFSKMKFRLFVGILIYQVLWLVGYITSLHLLEIN